MTVDLAYLERRDGAIDTYQVFAGPAQALAFHKDDDVPAANYRHHELVLRVCWRGGGVYNS